ncbi:hypothetical protein U91I_03828 [alpha proteobacterium U9-1i]|nr:hypothetical protein U91I_03828 [alpha proteobacterium U9-1i]
MKALAAIIVALTLTACATAHREPAPAFRPALEAHLNAIAARDIDALIPTLTSGEALPMLAPTGHKWNTRQDFIDFHRAWFAAADNGRLEFEIVSVIESTDLAHALMRYRYSSIDAAGATQTSTAWLTLTFALEGGGWRLVFDQNTLIS